MSDVVISLPGIELGDSEGLIGDWVNYASLPMYDDGKIRWYGDDKLTRKAVRHIEACTGIDFKRTRDINKAEIISERGDTGNKNWTGVASWTNEEKVWRLCVKEGTGKKLRSTMVHEFAHALGMAHPENHWTTTDTVMSYGRNKKRNPGLYPRDIDILTGLYID